MSEIDLTSAEAKKAIADAAAALVEEEVKGLKAKNNELIEANKKLRKGQEIDPAEFQALEAERDDLRGKLSEANKAVAKANKAAEDAIKKATETDTAYSKSLSDAALTEALTKAGVTNPVHLKAAKALLASGVQVVDENGSRVVKAGDKALSDFITEWAGGDEGKHFVGPAGTTGDGAQGAGRFTGTAPKRSEMSVTDKAAYVNKHGQEAFLKLPD